MISSEDKTSQIKSPAVLRGIEVLRLIGRSEAPLGVNSIARELNIVPSTCLHILRALEIEGLVQAGSTDLRWSLTAEFVKLARSSLDRLPGVHQAQPLMQTLANIHGASTALLNIGAGSRSTVVATAHRATAFGLVIEVGRRFSVYSGASGRCVTASRTLSQVEMRSIHGSLRWGRPLSYEVWRKEIEFVRAEGFAIDDGWYLRGFINAAVPIYRDGALWRTLVCIISRGQLTSVLKEDLVSAMKATAKTLSS